MKATTLANWESKFRSILTKFPPKIVISKYSQGRLDFLEKLKETVPSPSEIYIPPEELSRELWGINFRSPIMNAAGMFKNGECYQMVGGQGAGAYLGGTGTINPRKGNEKLGIYLPFVPYPKSHAASNFLGLPNDGDRINSLRAAESRRLHKIDNFPIGWSVMKSSDKEEGEKLKFLVSSMLLYDEAGVDFLEINESCPNTEGGSPQDDDLSNRLKYVKEHFLDQRTRRLPVVVKFSNDTEVEQLPALLDLLFELDYDGVNFGNTSTDYSRRRKLIHDGEHKLYDFFTINEDFGVGGGVSGRPLKESSLELASRAVEYLKAGKPSQEFHIIRTGGIETWDDIQQSEQAGISLNQWYTGYFESFANHGHDVYRELLSTSL